MSTSLLRSTPSQLTNSGRMNLISSNTHLGILSVSFYHRPSQSCNIKLCFSTSGLCSRLGTRCCVVSATSSKLYENKGINSSIDSQSRYTDLKDDMGSSLSILEEQLRDLFNEVHAMIRIGKENEARDLLLANFEAVKEQIDAGLKGIEEAAILDVIALGYMALGDIRTVKPLLDVLSEVVDDLKDEEPLLDSILTHMGNMYEKLENFEMSICVYGRAVKVVERLYGNTSSFVVTPLLGMAKVLGSTGKTKKAIETYQRVVKILESSRGEESEELVVPLFGMGNLLLKERRVTDAENAFNRILTTYMKLYGENDGRVGLSMSYLARVKCAKGDVNEAIDLYKEALRRLKVSDYIAIDDHIMEKMRVDLAELLHAVGRGEEGRMLLEECLLITEKFRGEGHPSSVSHLVNLATSYSQSKLFAEAERLLRMSLHIMYKNVSPDDQSITFPMLHLAVTLYNLNRNEEAEKHALEVLRIRERAFGEDSLPVGEALDCLVSIQTQLGKDDGELLELLKRVLKIQEKAFGTDSEEVMETLKKVVYYLEKMGRKHEGLPLERRLSKLRTKFKQMVQY
ncbi:nephrocystin-3 isoform X1 [Solanum pennellii]|uniref:Nephrocystin-3 isoform X1 n=1 Tax=Solanum pennellii TaxID=28526 RepID=A0ABM1V7E1_SOLPN|nr:nephrocystin-3 isoform X1 [Solanum pennellii]XP_027771659.1 nephrocystin-3 isoform X1 [Solanum pennellii]